MWTGKENRNDEHHDEEMAQSRTVSQRETPSIHCSKNETRNTTIKTFSSTSKLGTLPEKQKG